MTKTRAVEDDTLIDVNVVEDHHTEDIRDRPGYYSTLDFMANRATWGETETSLEDICYNASKNMCTNSIITALDFYEAAGCIERIDRDTYAFYHANFDPKKVDMKVYEKVKEKNAPYRQ